MKSYDVAIENLLSGKKILYRGIKTTSRRKSINIAIDNFYKENWRGEKKCITPSGKGVCVMNDDLVANLITNGFEIKYLNKEIK